MKQETNQSNRVRRILALICLAACLGWALPSQRALASSDSTGYTVTMNTDGKLQIVQDAYLPTAAYMDLNLNRPEDLFIQGDYLYVADTGNRRAIRLHLETGKRDIFGMELLTRPTGIAADADGRVYVADAGNSEAYRFNPDLELEQVFLKPDSPKFGRTSQFRPTKVAPANGGGVYLVNEGSIAGLVHMDGGGGFLGYFGSSDVRMSAFDRLMDLILSEQQMARFLRRTPPSFANIYRAADGLVYSVNRGQNIEVNKHNIGGLNILKNDDAPQINDAVDLTVTPEGEIFVIDNRGYITEITADGFLVAIFAGPTDGTDRAGLFNVPTGIASDASGRVYVLDQQKNYVQVFTPTRGQAQLHSAINAYMDGDYGRSTGLLQDVVRINNTSRLAHTYLGKNYMQAARFEEAAHHFRLSNQTADYSEAFWEIRNQWLQANLLVVFFGVIAAIAAFMVRKNRKQKKARAINEGVYEASKWERFRDSNRLVYDFSRIPYAATHPTDHAYEVARGRSGTYTSATLIFLVFFIFLVTLQIGSGYIFSQDIKYYSFASVAAFFLAAVFLFIACNFLIAAIRDGKGQLRSIYVVTAYSLSPLILLLPIAILIGNVSTLNEAFFYNLVLALAVVWTLICLVSAMQQIHEYKFSTTVWNLLLTVFAMLIVAIVISLLYLIVRQLIYQLQEMYLELSLRS